MPSKGRKRSLTPDDDSPRGRGSPSPRIGSLATRNDGKSPISPKSRSRSPNREIDSPVHPAEGNGGSLSPREDRSPVDDDDDDDYNRRSP